MAPPAPGSCTPCGLGVQGHQRGRQGRCSRRNPGSQQFLRLGPSGPAPDPRTGQAGVPGLGECPAPCRAGQRPTLCRLGAQRGLAWRGNRGGPSGRGASGALWPGLEGRGRQRLQVSVCPVQVPSGVGWEPGEVARGWTGVVPESLQAGRPEGRHSPLPQAPGCPLPHRQGRRRRCQESRSRAGPGPRGPQGAGYSPGLGTGCARPAASPRAHPRGQGPLPTSHTMPSIPGRPHRSRRFPQLAAHSSASGGGAGGRPQRRAARVGSFWGMQDRGEAPGWAHGGRPTRPCKGRGPCEPGGARSPETPTQQHRCRALLSGCGAPRRPEHRLLGGCTGNQKLYCRELFITKAETHGNKLGGGRGCRGRAGGHTPPARGPQHRVSQ